MGYTIQRPDIGALLQSFFRLTGRIPLELESFVLPTVQVGDLAGGATPPVTRRAVMTFTQAAVAAERAVWRLEVPGNVIAVVRDVWVETNGGTSITVFFGSSFAVVPTTLISARFTDGRLLQNLERPAGVIIHDTQVAALAATNWRRTSFASPDILPWTGLNWVCGSGDPDQFGFIEFAANALNVQVSVQMTWDEYQLN